MSIFKIVLIALTVTPLLSNAYECQGVTRNGMPVYVSTQRVYQDNLANVRVDVGAQSNVAAASVFTQVISTVGHSRCPGTWTESTMSPTYSNSVLESLSIRVNPRFFGCGVAPSSSIAIKLFGVSELVALSCKE